MADLSPKVIAGWIIKLDQRTPANIKSIAYEAIKGNVSGWSEEEIFDVAESNVSHIIKELEIIRNDLLESGVTPDFDLEFDGDSVYILYKERSELEVLKRLLKISPVDFEGFCSKLIQALGGESFVTGGSNDGGIDFIGKNIPVGSISNSNAGSKVFLLGQAKRYQRSKMISLVMLREFIGSTMRMRHEMIDKEKIGIFNPVIFAYWTTSDFNIHAKEYAKRMGIWYLNGIALSQMATKYGLNSVGPISTNTAP